MIKKYNVKVFVESTYLEDHSDPYEDSYLWSYKVVIKNNEKEKIKLISRHWKIFDSNGGTPLKTSSGIMHGSYLMLSFDGEEFKVDIPAFSLDIPNQGNNLN